MRVTPPEAVGPELVCIFCKSSKRDEREKKVSDLLQIPTER